MTISGLSPTSSYLLSSRAIGRTLARLLITAINELIPRGAALLLGFTGSLGFKFKSSPPTAGNENVTTLGYDHSRDKCGEMVSI